MSDYQFKKKTLSNYRSYRSPYLLDSEKKLSDQLQKKEENYYRKYRFKKKEKNVKKNETFKYSNSYQKNKVSPSPRMLNSNFLLNIDKNNLEKNSNSSGYNKKRYMKFNDEKQCESSYNNSRKNLDFIRNNRELKFLTHHENFQNPDLRSISNRDSETSMNYRKNFMNKKFLNPNLKINSAMNSLEKNRYVGGFNTNLNTDYLELNNSNKLKKDFEFKILILEKKNRNFLRDLKKKDKEIIHLKKITQLDKECLKNFEMQKKEMLLNIQELQISINNIKGINENLQNENFCLKESGILNNNNIRKSNENIRKSNENLFNLKKRTSLSNKNEHIFSTTFSEQLYGKLNEKKFKKEKNYELDLNGINDSDFSVENNLNNCNENLKNILHKNDLKTEDKNKLMKVINNLSDLKMVIKTQNNSFKEESQKPLFLSRIQKDLETLIKNINLKKGEYSNENMESQIKQLKKNLSFFIKSNKTNIDNDNESLNILIHKKLQKLVNILKIEISDLNKDKCVDKNNLKLIDIILHHFSDSNNNSDDKKNSVIINESYLSLKTFQNNLSSIIYEKEKNFIFETNEQNITNESLEQNIRVLKEELKEYKKFLKGNFEKIELIEKENMNLERLSKNKINKENLKNNFIILQRNLNNIKINDEDNKFDLDINEQNINFDKNEQNEDIKILKEKMVKKNLILEEKNSIINCLHKELEDLKKNTKNLSVKNSEKIIQENTLYLRQSVSDRNIIIEREDLSDNEEKLIKSVNFEEIEKINKENFSNSFQEENKSNSLQEENKSKMVNEIEDFIKEIVEKHKIEKEEFLEKIKNLTEINGKIESELNDYKIQYQKLMIVNLHMTKIKNENKILKKKIIEFEKLEEKDSYILSSESDEDFECEIKISQIEIEKENIEDENLIKNQRKESVNFFVIENIFKIIQEENFINLKEEEFTEKFEELTKFFEMLKFKDSKKKEIMMVQLDQYKELNIYKDVNLISDNITTIEKNIIKKNGIQSKLIEMIKKLKKEKNQLKEELKNKNTKMTELKKKKDHLYSSDNEMDEKQEDFKLEQEFLKMRISDVEKNLEFLMEEIKTQNKKINSKEVEIGNMESYLNKSEKDIIKFNEALESNYNDKLEFQENLLRKKEIIKSIINNLS